MPALALAERLREQGHEPLLLTEGREVEHDLLARAGATSASLQVGRRTLLLPLRIAAATLAARRLMRDRGIDLVLGTGGKTSIPAGLAARSLGLPLCLLEQNATTGRSNRLLSPLANRVYLGLPQPHASARALMTGTPMRRGIGEVERASARQQLGLEPDLPVLLVMGGSQGATALNTIVPKALCALRRPLQILHLSGRGAEEGVRLLYDAGQERGLTAHVRALVQDMPAYYAAADLVICRGGGCTVAELMRAARPAIIVPYPHHRDRQQFWNGMVLERARAGLVLEQSHLSVTGLAALIESFLRRPEELAAMGERSRALAPVDPSAAILADLRLVANLN